MYGRGKERRFLRHTLMRVSLPRAEQPSARLRRSNPVVQAAGGASERFISWQILWGHT
jgi:hypothetical protein